MLQRARQIISGGFGQGARVVAEAGNRLVGGTDLVANLAGWRLPKNLRLRVVILRDEAGQPLAEADAVLLSILEMAAIFRRVARVMLLPADPMLITVTEPSPAPALDVHCDDGAWQEDLGPAGAYFRQLCAKNLSGRLLGYGEPVTVFIVRQISKKGGCSLGPLTNYVTLKASTLKRTQTLLAHEVGHACGLWHSSDKPNLMYPNGPGNELTPLQIAILRNSRHVTYL